MGPTGKSFDFRGAKLLKHAYLYKKAPFLIKNNWGALRPLTPPTQPLYKHKIKLQLVFISLTFEKKMFIPHGLPKQQS